MVNGLGVKMNCRDKIAATKKNWRAGLAAVAASTLMACSSPTEPSDRELLFGSLFTGAEQYENFNRINMLMPTTTLSPANKAYRFPEGDAIELPTTYAFRGSALSSKAFLEETDTSALLVIKSGEIRYENYRLTGARDVNWLSMSVAKSFISALIGIAIEEGAIGSVEDPVTQYVPNLAGSAYDGVRIKDILQMSSGAKWNEDYSDPNSDIGRLGLTLATGASLNAFSATLVRDKTPGTVNLYNSTDTQVLGEMLTMATGRSITDYMQEKLWEPLGMEYPAYWIADGEGMEMAFGGLNATVQDYAKLGELYRNGGRWGDKQVVPQAWVVASTNADAPHLQVGASDFGMGYGYQWWLHDGDQGEYSAIGVYNQFIYVNPAEELVIVKLSANNTYGMTNEEESYRELETVDFFRAIASVLRES